MSDQPSRKLSPLERMTPEQRAEVIKKAQEARKRNRELGDAAPKRKLTPIRAIRMKCMDCSGYQPSEVKRCTVNDCPLFVYRLGKRPKDIVDALNTSDNEDADDADETEDEGIDEEQEIEISDE